MYNCILIFCYKTMYKNKNQYQSTIDDRINEIGRKITPLGN